MKFLITKDTVKDFENLSKGVYQAKIPNLRPHPRVGKLKLIVE
jgi:hypothetical protein